MATSTAIAARKASNVPARLTPSEWDRFVKAVAAEHGHEVLRVCSDPMQVATMRSAYTRREFKLFGPVTRNGARNARRSIRQWKASLK